jgi:hypothetical protein
MANKLPALQFYPGDWLKDPSVSMCSPSTRGIWVDFLCAMHNLDRCGQLTGNYAQLSRIARCSPAEAEVAVKELHNTKTADVIFCNNDVTITNRRMMREHNERLDIKKRVSGYRERMKQDCNENVTSYTSCSSSSSSSITYSFTDRKFLNITTGDIEIWKKTYPAVDIEGNILRAGEWLFNNPSKAKKNYGRFLTNWFSRTQERGGDNGRPKQTQRTPISQNDYSSGGSIPVCET